GTIERDVIDAVRFRDHEIGVVRVPRTAMRAVRPAGRPTGVLGLDPPADAADAEPPATYIRWDRPGDGESGGLQTGTGRWFHPPTGTTVFVVGVVHIGDAEYFGELQKLLDMSDLVLFEGVGRGAAGDEQIAR